MSIPKNFSEIELERSEEVVTGKVGLSWIYHCMIDFGIGEIVRDVFPKAGSNREIDVVQKIMVGVLMLIAGGEKVEDIENLRVDKALVKSLGLEAIISPDTFLNFLGNEGNMGRIKEVMRRLALEAMRRHLVEELTYDIDATYFDSGKECATWSYNKGLQMSGLLGFFVEMSGLCVTMDYRTGKVPAGMGIIDQLMAAHKLAIESGKELRHFRSDSAAHDKRVMSYCLKNGIWYYISIDKNEVVKEIIHSIPDEEWEPVPGQDGREWAESIYVMGNGKESISMRILVLRWQRRGQLGLFDIDGYKYHVIATNNDEIEPMEWLEFHNGRMNSENYNKELKNGFSAGYTPSNNFIKDANYFYISILAYNIFQLMKLFYLGGKAGNWTIKTCRYWFINVCGKFVKHARKFFCKIINVTDLSYGLFESCLSRLVLSDI